MKLKLVFIEWLDSYGCSPNWQPLEGNGPAKRLVCRSVGWLYRDDKDYKVIVPHVSDGKSLGIPTQGCGDMTIPAKSIIRMIALKEPESACGLVPIFETNG